MADPSGKPTALINRVAIIGLGLIGGSIGKAIRLHGLAGQVVGFAGEDHGQQALALGLIDEVAPSLADAVSSADLVIVATPVTVVPSVFEHIARHLGEQAIITDCASTKASVVLAARQYLGAAFGRYVPGHPIAGSEFSGPTAAREGLFEGKRWLFSPVNRAQERHVDGLMDLVRGFGARPAILDAAEHDALFAEYSHAPHALVYALCLAVADGPHADRLADLAGAGFRDTTRIGASSPSLWADILFDNAEPTLASLGRVRQALDEVAAVLASGDKTALQAVVARASDWRAKLESSSQERVKERKSQERKNLSDSQRD